MVLSEYEVFQSLRPSEQWIKVNKVIGIVAYATVVEVSVTFSISLCRTIMTIIRISWEYQKTCILGTRCIFKEGSIDKVERGFGS